MVWYSATSIGGGITRTLVISLCIQFEMCYIVCEHRNNSCLGL